jgi:hypothetical protein
MVVEYSLETKVSGHTDINKIYKTLSSPARSRRVIYLIQCYTDTKYTIIFDLVSGCNVGAGLIDG